MVTHAVLPPDSPSAGLHVRGTSESSDSVAARMAGRGRPRDSDSRQSGSMICFESEGLVGMLGYTVVLEAERDGGFVVSVPALPGCFTQGETRDEALKNAREAIAAYVEELRARGEEVPVEVKTETEYLELPELEFGT